MYNCLNYMAINSWPSNSSTTLTNSTFIALALINSTILLLDEQSENKNY